MSNGEHSVQIARLETQMQAVREDLAEIKRDVKSLSAWRWQLVGSASVAVVAGGYALRLVGG